MLSNNRAARRRRGIYVPMDLASCVRRYPVDMPRPKRRAIMRAAAK